MFSAAVDGVTFTGQNVNSLLSFNLPAGNYTLGLSSFPNFAEGPFLGDGYANPGLDVGSKPVISASICSASIGFSACGARRRSARAFRAATSSASATGRVSVVTAPARQRFRNRRPLAKQSRTQVGQLSSGPGAAAGAAAQRASAAGRAGLTALVVLAPLPFAGQHPLAWSILGTLVGALLLLWAGAAALDRREINPLFPRLWPLVALFALVPLWTIVQAGAWTPRGWHSPLWQLARFVVPDASGRITIDPHATGTAAMRLLTYGGVFWLAFQHGRRAPFARATVKALAAAGLGYAAYGLYVYASGRNLVLWLPRPCCRGDLTSTFVNRNHYAPYAGIGLLCALGLIVTTLRSGGSALGRAGARRACSPRLRAAGGARSRRRCWRWRSC